MSMRWLEEKVQVLGAPGQLGMTPAEWQWWNTSGAWKIYVFNAAAPFPVFPLPGGDDYVHEDFPLQSGITFNTVLRWVAVQRMRALYEQWSKKTSKPLKVCALEFVPKGANFEPFDFSKSAGSGNANYYCYDPVSKSLNEVLSTGTQIKTTCPPGYSKIVHDDGSFGCIPPYLPTLPAPMPTPPGYRQPLTTIAPIFPSTSRYRPPVTIQGPGDLGALPDADVAMAKAILAAWNGTDGNNSIGSYGLQPADISLVWGDRDGWTLANFYNWWNKSGWAPPLPNPTTKNEIAWQDLTTQGLYSLKVWAQAKGITIVPGQLPNPGFPSAPAPSAPVPSAPTPQVPLPRVPTPVPGNPSDVTQCDPGFHWDPVSKLCVVTPLPIPPTPIPGGGTPSSSESGGNTGILIAVGALALLGLGAAIFGGGSSGATAATPKRPAARSNPSNENAFWSGWFKKTPLDEAESPQTPPGVYYVYDNHDGTVYRVSGAPSQDAAATMVSRRLRRGPTEAGIRDLPQGPAPHERVVRLGYRSPKVQRSAQRAHKRRARGRKRRR
ncbi:MAG TPA: hypothetical protein VE967_19260 [Gemmatimonadaceae bacterium]|nr:hypothetical protein [Gemmatimonadaceae bacterium]